MTDFENGVENLREPVPIDDATDRERRGIHWQAAVGGGIAGGAVMLGLAMIFVPLFTTGSVWLPLRMVATLVLGRPEEMPPNNFELWPLLLGLFIHFMLAVIYGVILAWIIHNLKPASGVLAGALFGLALYVLNFYVGGVAFPWYHWARNWISLVGVVAFGIVAAWVFEILAEKFPAAY
ncbi:MAG: hypothetical protein ABI718_12500 [Acidobacteriota bacterium]